MANLVLVGQIQCEINHVFGVTITKMSVDGDRPATLKSGAQGPIGIAVGIEKPTFNITLAVPVTGLEFDITGALDQPGGFTFSFPIGLEKHSLYGCTRTKRGLSNNPEAGDSEFTLNCAATEWVRTR